MRKRTEHQIMVQRRLALTWRPPAAWRSTRARPAAHSRRRPGVQPRERERERRRERRIRRPGAGGVYAARREVARPDVAGPPEDPRSREGMRALERREDGRDFAWSTITMCDRHRAFKF
jgi:hypothetical protein